MNVLFLVYTSHTNVKRYWVEITHPATGADTTNFQYFGNGGFTTIQTSDPNYPTSAFGSSQSSQVSYTPDGQYLAMATSSGILGYIQEGATISQLSFPTVATGFVDVKFSSDSNFVVGVNTLAPTAVCYQRGANNIFHAVGNLSTLHTYPSYCCDFSVGGNYLAIGGTELYLYQKTISTFASLASPISVSIQAVKFSLDGSTLYVGTSAGVQILNRAGSIFTVNTSWNIPGNIQGFDVYSKYLAVTTDVAVTVYDTTLQQSVYTQAVTNAKSVRFSSDGETLAVEQTAAPFFEVLQWLQ